MSLLSVDRHELRINWISRSSSELCHPVVGIDVQFYLRAKYVPSKKTQRNEIFDSGVEEWSMCQVPGPESGATSNY